MIPVSVAYNDPLFEGILSSGIEPKDAQRLVKTPLVGGIVELLGPGEARRQIQTIEQMRQAEKEGFFAATTGAIALRQHFQLASDLLNALLIAQPSKATYLVSISRVDLLPATHLTLSSNANSTDQTQLSQGKPLSVAEMAAAGMAKVLEATDKTLIIEANIRCRLIELLRGDLDGDGVEDVLIWQGCEVLDGTMAWGGSLALTRHDNSSSFSKVHLSFL